MLRRSRRPAVPSRHRRDSCPSDEVVGGFFSEIEPFRTASSDRDAPRSSKNGELKQEDVDSLHEEVAVLRSVDHPNIVKLYDFFDEKRYYYMAIELMEGGELFERIVKKTFYNEMDARGLVRILLDALAYLHHRGIVHRDLKPENL